MTFTAARDLFADAQSFPSLFDGAAEPAATLPVGTRLRVVDQPGGLTAEGDPFVQVQGLDDPSIAGFMAATDLAPRDSAAPVVRALEPGGPFSVFCPWPTDVPDLAVSGYPPVMLRAPGLPERSAVPGLDVRVHELGAPEVADRVAVAAEDVDHRSLAAVLGLGVVVAIERRPGRGDDRPRDR